MSEPGSPARPPAAVLVLRQIRYQNRMFWRQPVAVFFTFVFPLIFIFLFNLLFGGQRLESRGGIPFAQFLTPAIATFAVISACYTNLVIGTAIARDHGILKRIRGTPCPPWIYVAGRIGSAVWIAAISVVVLVLVGVVLYHVRIVWQTLPAAILTLAVGAACFCALGLAAAAFTPTGDSAPAVANATLLPLAFISDIFFPMDAAPTWLRTLASVFPLRHFALAMQADFSPLTAGSGLQWSHLAVMAAWGVGGLLLALRYFRWEPKEGAGRGRGRPRRRAVPSAE